MENLKDEDLKISLSEPLRNNRWVLRVFEEKKEDEKYILDTCCSIKLDYVNQKMKRERI